MILPPPLRRALIAGTAAAVVALLAACTGPTLPGPPATPGGRGATLHASTGGPAAAPSSRGETPHQSDPTPRLVISKEELAGRPFNTALERLAAEAVAQKATLVLPAGDYTTPATVVLPPGTDLRLDSAAAINGALPGSPLLRISSKSSITGGTLRNTATSPGFDLDLGQGATGVRVAGVTFSGATSNALYIAAPGVKDVVIERSRFDGVGYGILLNPGAIDARGIRIRNNTFRNVCADSIEINAATGGTERRVRDVTISGNDIGPSCGAGDSSGFGVGLAGVRDFVVIGNTIHGARSEAVHLEDGTSDGMVSNNVIAGGGASRPAIAIYRTTVGVVVSGNTISRFNGPGIGVRWDQLGSAQNIAIRANTVRDVAGDGIAVAGDAGTGPFTVTGNRVENVQGAGISVAGSHALTVISNNTLHGIVGRPIAESLRGTGTTRISENAIGD